MKKTLFAAAAMFCAVAAFAQGDNYNRLGVSYTNTHFGLNDAGKMIINGNADEMVDGDFGGLSTNGFSIDYVHGWSLSNSLPMYLEAGVSFGFNAGGATLMEDVDKWSDYFVKYKNTVKLQNMNLTIPVNFVWSFKNVFGTPLTISPYTGINFKLNLMQRGKIVGEVSDHNLPASMTDYLEEYTDDTSSKWMNLFNNKMVLDAMDEIGEKLDEEEIEEYTELGKKLTWNRFQMGWQIGVGFRFENYHLGLEYNLDFLPAYSKSWVVDTYLPMVGEVPVEYKPRVNTGTFKLSLAYYF